MVKANHAVFPANTAPAPINGIDFTFPVAEIAPQIPVLTKDAAAKTMSPFRALDTGMKEGGQGGNGFFFNPFLPPQQKDEENER
jgi:hypothetical protein